MRYVRWIVASLGFLVVGARSSLVLATYSIAATDGVTQQVGGAVTSCVGSLDLASVYGSVPGLGVVHAQAQLDARLRGKNRAVQRIEQGVDPAQVIAMITSAGLDSGFASRQYGIVDVQGRAAGFTGAQAQAYKKDQQGRTGSFAYSVQGNILTSQRVLDQAAAGFEANACDLADRLMAALEAGGRNGEGDSRCTRNGIPSDAAFIQVDLPGRPAGSWLKLSVSDTAPENPLPKLRAMFDTWRRTHPCMPGSSSAGVGGAAPSGTGGPAATSAGLGAAAVGGAPAGGARQSAGTGGTASAAGAAAIAGASVSRPDAGAAGAVASSAGAGAAALGAGSWGAGVRGAAGHVGTAESSVGTAGAGAGTTGQNTSSAGPTCGGSCAAGTSAQRARGSCAVRVGDSDATFGAALLLGTLALVRARARARARSRSLCLAPPRSPQTSGEE